MNILPRPEKSSSSENRNGSFRRKEILAGRNVIFSPLFGLLLSRLATPALLALLFQEPLRLQRLEPDAEPVPFLLKNAVNLKPIFCRKKEPA